MLADRYRCIVRLAGDRARAAPALFALLAMLAAAPAAHAQQGRVEVNVIGLFSDSAVLVINGGNPRTLKAGQATPEGVRLVSANSQQAVVEINGRRETLSMGQSIAGQRSTAGRQQAVLMSDGRGHFWANAEINGSTAKVLVDTGATYLSMSNATARRLGINFLQGQRGFTSTANGTVPVYRVTLASVRVGDIALTNVDASVHEGDSLPVILLGMSFLNRVEMQRDGDRMTLIRRF
ncbi:MAG: TIGR02281 family clan AA aspartic protease [bacterium]|jgi:aspartyl protease family protein